MRAIQAILWDMDGTLVNSEPVHWAALARLLTRHGHPVEASFAAQYLGTPLADIHRDLQRRFGLSQSLGDFADELQESYVSNAHLLEPRHGALEAWAFAAEAGFSQAVVSNADRIIVQTNLNVMKLARAGFVSVSINDVRHGKPDAEPYLRAAYLLDLPPQACVVVEDSPVGARSGLAAGMTVIAWPEHEETLDLFPAGVLRADGLDLMARLTALSA